MKIEVPSTQQPFESSFRQGVSTYENDRQEAISQVESLVLQALERGIDLKISRKEAKWGIKDLQVDFATGRIISITERYGLNPISRENLQPYQVAGIRKLLEVKAKKALLDKIVSLFIRAKALKTLSDFDQLTEIMEHAKVVGTGDLGGEKVFQDVEEQLPELERELVLKEIEFDLDFISPESPYYIKKARGMIARAKEIGLGDHELVQKAEKILLESEKNLKTK